METSFHVFIPWWVASEVNCCCCSVAKSCLTLWDPMDCSTPGSSVLRHLPVCSNSFLLIYWCHPTISSSVTHFSFCSQSFPASQSFPMSWLFPSGGQRIVALLNPLEEVPLPDPSALLSYFLLLLLRWDARNCCPVKIIITVAGAGVESRTHQRPKDLSLPLGHAQSLWLRNCLSDLLISWPRLSPETCGCPSAFSPKLCIPASCLRIPM